MFVKKSTICEIQHFTQFNVFNAYKWTVSIKKTPKIIDLYVHLNRVDSHLYARSITFNTDELCSKNVLNFLFLFQISSFDPRKWRKKCLKRCAMFWSWFLSPWVFFCDFEFMRYDRFCIQQWLTVNRGLFFMLGG